MTYSFRKAGWALACAVLAFAGFQSRASAGPLAFSLTQVGAFGGEPSLSTDTNGLLYDSSPSGPDTFRSNDKGATWTQIQSPDTTSGDTCINTDAENSLYWCNLNGNPGLPLQVDVYKSTSPTITTCTSNCSWQYGNNATTGGTCNTSCNPFGVDRQWVGSTIRPGHTTATADVVLMYHDFYGPSHIWVNISHDGGATFGTAQEILAAGATTNPNGTITAEGYTFCNTIPAGVSIVPPDAPAAKHPGRVFVAWLASDLASDASGCNLTMAAAFHTLWVSYSDDALTAATPTWSPQMAFDTGIGHDASTPFIAFTLDRQGDPYFGVTAPGPNEVFATCAAESTAGTVQSDATCSYRMWVVWSQDGGNTWNGGGGTLPDPPGSAAAAYLASPATQTGTDVFPTIAAGDPGKVDIAYLHTDEIVPTDAAGKFVVLGCDRDDYATPPPNYPPRCHWNLFASQSLNLTASPSAATWTNLQVTSVPMHYGDICNLGIACPVSIFGVPVPRDPRNLLDFNQEVVDPTTGCAHIAYADDNEAGSTYGDPANPSPLGGHLASANQTDGPSVIGTGLCGQAIVTPESPWSVLLPLAGAAAAVGAGVYTRRRRRLAVG
ncbi:MAG: hypothetical protein E6J45_04650 [Chloroflexi bacterium]|nr:MAG: hypothetical protein E6J45_04650 [Chloroflexota bacterium]